MATFLRGEDFIEDMIERIDDWQSLPASCLNVAFNLSQEYLENDFRDLSTKESWSFDATEDFDSFKDGLSEIAYTLTEEFKEFLKEKGFDNLTAQYFTVLSLSYFESHCLKKAKPEMDFTVNQLRLAVDRLTDHLEGSDLLNITALCPSLRLFQSYLYQEEYQDKALFTQNTFQIDQFLKELKVLFESRIDERLPCFAYLQAYPQLPWEEEEKTVLNTVKGRAKLRSKNSQNKKSLFKKIFGL